MKALLLLFVTLSTLWSQSSLKVAVASNVQFAMEEIKQAFMKESGIPITLIIGSSGKLTAQIKNGAPYDLFLSANMKYPAYLFDMKMTQTIPTKYALGKLVYWSMYPFTTTDIPTLLQGSTLKHLVIANPKNAPYGTQAKVLLKNLGMLDTLQPKLVFGDNISQTNQYIFSKSADAGFTAKSVVLSPKMRGKGYWLEPDSTLYHPIEQGMVILKGANPQAKRFFAFMQTPTASAILKRYGYALPGTLQ